MADYGIKVSKPGSSVVTADEKDLVYSSAFNSLKVAQKDNFVADATTETVSHSLGYKPAFLSYQIDTNIGTTGYVMSDIVLGKDVYTTTTDIVFQTYVGNTISYFLFYDPVQASASYIEPKTRDYGMKMSNVGTDVFTGVEKDISFSSSYQTLQIRDTFPATGDTLVGPTAGNTVTVTHNYGYPPAFLAWYENAGNEYVPDPYYVDTGGAIDVLYCESKTNTIDIVSPIDLDASGWNVRILLFTESLL